MTPAGVFNEPSSAPTRARTHARTHRFPPCAPTTPQQGHALELPERPACGNFFLAGWFLWVKKAPKVPKNFAARGAAVVFYSLENRCFGACAVGT